MWARGQKVPFGYEWGGSVCTFWFLRPFHAGKGSLIEQRIVSRKKKTSRLESDQFARKSLRMEGVRKI